jgi:HEAT repeat protein
MPNMMVLQHNLRRMRQGLRAMPAHMPTPAIPPMPPMNPFEEEKLEPGTRLKMEALYALGEKEDEKAYQTLKEVALDQKQPRPLREAAIHSLSDFKKFDVLPVYMEIVRKDTNEEVQNSAIQYISQLGKDKNKSVETLAELFSTVPKRRTGQLETILFAVADIGNDKAVDFLTMVARTHESYDLRSDAVYYLGNIGGDKARAALYDILKGK